MDNFLGEIRFFSGPTVPRGWAECNGQQLVITQNQAIYALIGSQFGGDNKTVFNLPDLRGRVMINWTTTSGINPVLQIGNKGGTETVALTTAMVPSHQHNVQVVNANGSKGISPPPTGTSGSVLPAQTVVAGLSNENILQYLPQNPNTNTLIQLAPGAVEATGGSGGHENRMPYQVLNPCIAMQGVWPPRQ